MTAKLSRSAQAEKKIPEIPPAGGTGSLEAAVAGWSYHELIRAIKSLPAPCTMASA
jgi:hypothetical protein